MKKMTKTKKKVVRPPVYRFCRVCGVEAAKGPEREAHFEADHNITGDALKKMIRTPRLAWSKTKPKDEELVDIDSLGLA